MNAAVDIPVIDEATVMARLDALVAKHGLPETSRHFNPSLWAGDEFMLEYYGVLRIMTVRVPVRADVARWAAVLGVEPRTEHTIHEYDDGRWCAVWRESVSVERWLGDVRLSVVHSEDRWIDRPAVAS